VKDFTFVTVEDRLGWQEQGDGKYCYAVYVDQGRVKDDGGPRYRSAFRKIAQTLKLPMVITPNTNMIFADIDPAQRAEFITILANHKIAFASGMTAARRVAHACVALPTCGLSLSESERVFGGVMEGIDGILRELKLENEPILIRMTGCPNGCARPYNADIGFVGRAPGKYAMFVGGSIRGDRLAGLEKKVIALADIPNEVRPLLTDFAQNRKQGETFTEFWGRTRVKGEEPTPEQFHVEFTERAAKAAAEAAAAAAPAPTPAPAPAPAPAEPAKAAAEPVAAQPVADTSNSVVRMENHEMRAEAYSQALGVAGELWRMRAVAAEEKVHLLQTGLKALLDAFSNEPSSIQLKDVPPAPKRDS
jgi:hypothetical protein